MAMDPRHVLIALEKCKAEYLTTATAREIALARAKSAAAYAKTIAPVGARAHKVSANHYDEPGDFKDSIDAEVIFKRGAWRGRVIARDYKAHWIEYGTKKMKKQAIMRRAAAHARGGV